MANLTSLSVTESASQLLWNIPPLTDRCPCLPGKAPHRSDQQADICFQVRQRKKVGTFPVTDLTDLWALAK